MSVYRRGKGLTDQADSERSMNMTRGGSPRVAGNVALADDLFSENVKTNGVLAGVARP